MDLHNFIASAPSSSKLRARIDALCKGHVFGESLDSAMLHVILEVLESNGSGDFAEEVAAINEEIKFHEDLKAINLRKRAYSVQLLLEKTRLPDPAKMLIRAGVLEEPLQTASRCSPSKFTLTEEFIDASGAVWTWAPYTGEAWRGSFK